MLRVLVLIVSAAFVLAPAVAAEDSPALEMWRLDCGKLDIGDLASFSDAHLYDGQKHEAVVSCYLIRNGDRYLLWDAGLSADLVGTTMTEGPFTVSMERSIVDQLGEIVNHFGGF